MKKFVLALDGGGIRGIVSARILNSLEIKIQKATNDNTFRIRDCFDLITGTSTGGILALLMSSLDFNMSRILQIYQNECSNIFKSSLLRRSIGILFKSKYDSQNFYESAYRLFGKKTLSDCKINCLIPSYDIKSCSPIFFSKDNSSNYNFNLVDIAMATSSAPTYFPPTVVMNTHADIAYNCIDGGIFANNPSLCGLIEIGKLNPEHNLSDFVIVSIGTGNSDKTKQAEKFKKADDWGTITWLSPLIETMFNSVADVTDYQVKKIYESVNLNITPSNIEQPCSYYRYQPVFDEFKYRNLDLSLDNIDPSNMLKLIEATEDYIKSDVVQTSMNRLVEDLKYGLDEKL